MAFLPISDGISASPAPAGAWLHQKPPRHIAVALPAKDEEADLPDCLAALDTAAARYDGPVSIAVLANNCHDGTAEVLARTKLTHARLHWTALSLLPAFAHAGWARRLAFDQAVSLLAAPGDVLACTDADTIVSPDWLARTVAHLEEGADAVAGRALTRRRDRAVLGKEAARRLNMLGRYYTALDWLRTEPGALQDPWPRHYYEGGASIALTLELYRRIGGAPTPCVGEDRALFAAVREAGGRVRHPLDVRVFTSSRTQGRASGGMAETFARWIEQDSDAPLHETYTLPHALDPAKGSDKEQLTFETLPKAIIAAQVMIRERQSLENDRKLETV